VWVRERLYACVSVCERECMCRKIENWCVKERVGGAGRLSKRKWEECSFSPTRRGVYICMYIHTYI